MYTASISVDEVIDALKVFVTPFMQGGDVVRGQVNRVPMPGNIVAVLTDIRRSDLSVPSTAYQPDDDTATIDASKKIDVQIDIYGEVAGEISAVIVQAFRSAWGFDNFPAYVKPLFCDDEIQIPLITGEQQYENRWMIVAHMQYNPTVTVPQQFADETVVNEIIPVDVFY